MGSLLKIDYDIPLEEAQQRFLKGKLLLEEITGLHLKESDWRKSEGGNYHVVVETEEQLEPVEILACQLIMGSDLVRECFNFRRIRRGQKNWNILFIDEPLTGTSV